MKTFLLTALVFSFSSPLWAQSSTCSIRVKLTGGLSEQRQFISERFMDLLSPYQNHTHSAERREEEGLINVDTSRKINRAHLKELTQQGEIERPLLGGYALMRVRVRALSLIFQLDKMKDLQEVKDQISQLHENLKAKGQIDRTSLSQPSLHIQSENCLSAL